MLISRKDVPHHIRSIVIESLMIAHARHEWSKSCKFLSQLTEQVPNRLQFSCFIVTDTGVCDISSEKDEIIRTNEVVLGYLIDHECAKGSISAHIPKNSNVHFLQCLNFQGWRSKVFHL